MASHIQSPGLPVGLPVERTSDDAAKAAKQMEAFFLRRMLAEVRPEGGGMLDGGFAGGTFREMLDSALADKMAEGGGVGLAKILERELDGSARGGAPGTSAAAPTVAPPAAARALSAYRAATGAGPAPLSAAPLPVEGITSSPFGRRIDPIDGDVRYHSGLDLAAPAGTPVHAVGAGTVVRAGASGGYGNRVVVDHGDGTETRYGHLSRVDVKAGQTVAAGATVGAVGQSGRATGPHLHLEVRQEGQAVDPEKYVDPLKAPKIWPTRQGGGQ